MYIPLDQVKTIQLDHTSRCNLMCPQCARVGPDHKVNSNLVMKDLTLDDYKTIFSPFLNKPVNIIQCGNYGDVLASPTFDETFDWCHSNNFVTTILTNGSLRNPTWWEQLAKKDPYVVFSVDGLEDTNHLYRVNSNFQKIKENILAFTSAGGKAYWDFIVFEHNKHQVDEVRELARSLGVIEFKVKNTTRFISTAGIKLNEVKTKKENIVVDRKNNPANSDLDHIINTYGSFSAYVMQTPITCKYKIQKQYYIDFNMRLWPCCWVGAPYLFDGKDDIQRKNIYEKITLKFGEEFNRLDIHGWEKVLEHEFYQSYLEESWHNENRLYTCGRTCGDKFEFSSAYSKNSTVERLK